MGSYRTIERWWYQHFGFVFTYTIKNQSINPLTSNRIDSYVFVCMYGWNSSLVIRVRNLDQIALYINSSIQFNKLHYKCTLIDYPFCLTLNVNDILSYYRSVIFFLLIQFHIYYIRWKWEFGGQFSSKCFLPLQKQKLSDLVYGFYWS